MRQISGARITKKYKQTTTTKRALVVVCDGSVIS